MYFCSPELIGHFNSITNYLCTIFSISYFNVLYCVGDEMSDNDLLLVTLSVKLLIFSETVWEWKWEWVGMGIAIMGKVMGME